MERRTVHYSGRVQGVGFRYSVARTAEDFAVTGWVRNLPDGRVLLVAEGPPSDLDAFLAAVRERMQGFLRGESSKVGTASGEFATFRIQP